LGDIADQELQLKGGGITRFSRMGEQYFDLQSGSFFVVKQCML
jgi:uncharacterized protein YdiU (UPF0061 family)